MGLFKKSFVFKANHYEEWQFGQCISQGPIDTTIKAQAKDGEILFDLDEIGDLRIVKQFRFATYEPISMDMGNRLQYVQPPEDNNPFIPIVCHVFKKGEDNIDYVRFAMSYPDRIIEFYGSMVALGEQTRATYLSNRTINNHKAMPIPSSFKNEFRNEIVSEYHKLLKGNTVSLAIIDHELEIIAFSMKKYLELIKEYEDSDNTLLNKVFKDTYSVVSDFFPMIGYGEFDNFNISIYNVAETWYKQLAVEPFLKAELCVKEYYSQLESGEPINCFLLKGMFNLR